jgi:hypothetical protein
MKFFLAPLLIGCALTVQAQTLTGARMEPAEVRVGEKSTLTADFDISNGALNCNVRVHFGDGKTEDFKINQTKDVPLVVNYTYAKPGTYTVMVEPKTVMPMFKCTGQNQRAAIKVVSASRTAAPAAPAAPLPQCPDGWKLDAKSLNKKSGAFTCTAKPNTPAPAGKLACPATLDYFESPRRGQIGCRP